MWCFSLRTQSYAEILLHVFKMDFLFDAPVSKYGLPSFDKYLVTMFCHPSTYGTITLFIKYSASAFDGELLGPPANYKIKKHSSSCFTVKDAWIIPNRCENQANSSYELSAFCSVAEIWLFVYDKNTWEWKVLFRVQYKSPLPCFLENLIFRGAFKYCEIWS